MSDPVLYVFQGVLNMLVWWVLQCQRKRLWKSGLNELTSVGCVSPCVLDTLVVRPEWVNQYLLVEWILGDQTDGGKNRKQMGLNELTCAGHAGLMELNELAIVLCFPRRAGHAGGLDHGGPVWGEGHATARGHLQDPTPQDGHQLGHRSADLRTLHLHGPCGESGQHGVGAGELVMWITMPVNWSCDLQCQWTGHVIYSASELVMWITVPVNWSCELQCQWTSDVNYSASELVMWITVPANWSCHVNYNASEPVMWITVPVNWSCELQCQ